jgi:hypothetical protein
LKNRTEGRVGGRREIERERKGAARKDEEEFEGGSPVQKKR